jgi:cytochrome c553|tara:strand:+ start:1576 stop:1893 length:318 start_codon:yes stop_codon:yes gene_type:complete
MVEIVLGAVMLLASSGTQADSSLNVLAESGKNMYEVLGCASCHGENGEGIDSYPALRGLNKEYIITQLKLFQSGERESSIMNAMAPMSEGHEEEIAEYLSTLVTP